MITSIVFDVDDTIYDQQAPYRIAMEKCFPDFDMSHMNQAYIRFRHYSDVGFPRVMAGEWTTEYFRFWRCKETLLEFGYREEEGYRRDDTVSLNLRSRIINYKNIR